MCVDPGSERLHHARNQVLQGLVLVLGPSGLLGAGQDERLLGTCTQDAKHIYTCSYVLVFVQTRCAKVVVRIYQTNNVVRGVFICPGT
jgi:hypothetical protein